MLVVHIFKGEVLVWDLAGEQSGGEAEFEAAGATTAASSRSFFQRVEQWAAMLLLDSLPEDLKNEVVSVRAVTVESMIFLVHCAYQSGGTAEKAYLLQFLTAPDSGTTMDAVLTLTGSGCDSTAEDVNLRWFYQVRRCL